MNRLDQQVAEEIDRLYKELSKYEFYQANTNRRLTLYLDYVSKNEREQRNQFSIHWLLGFNDQGQSGTEIVASIVQNLEIIVPCPLYDQLIAYLPDVLVHLVDQYRSIELCLVDSPNDPIDSVLSTVAAAVDRVHV